MYVQCRAKGTHNRDHDQPVEVSWVLHLYLVLCSAAHRVVASVRVRCVTPTMQNEFNREESGYVGRVSYPRMYNKLINSPETSHRNLYCCILCSTA